MTSRSESFDLVQFLPYRMSVAAERLSAGLARRYRKEFGISVAEWRILAHVTDAGAVSIRDIHLRVNVEKSKASRAASRLVAVGYLCKAVNPEDRRLVALTLTDQGRAVMDRLLAIALDFQAQLDALLAPHLQGLGAALDILMERDL